MIRGTRIEHSLQSKEGEEPSLADKLAGYMEDPKLANNLLRKETEFFATLNPDQESTLRELAQSLKHVKMDSEIGLIEGIKLKAKNRRLIKNLHRTFNPRQRELFKEYLDQVKVLLKHRKSKFHYSAGAILGGLFIMS